MSLEGSASGVYASLSGKIHALVIDKTLSKSGACADAKAVGDAIESINAVTVTEMQNTVKSEVAQQLTDAEVLTFENVQEAANEAVSNMATLTAEEIAAICV